MGAPFLALLLFGAAIWIAEISIFEIIY